MVEMRKDYLLDRWVIISEKRGKRPHQFHKEEIQLKDTLGLFLPGNEHMTPPEIGRIEEKGSWKIRWFPNKFAAVVPHKTLGKKKSKFFESMNAHGYHEIIVETPSNVLQLWDLPKDHITQLLQVYSLRIKTLSKKKGVAYVDVFKNHGREAGTSLVHSHSQIITLPFIPPKIQHLLDACKGSKACPYGEILGKEKKSKRFVFENKHFIVICPFASRYNYEVAIYPRKDIRSITDLNQEQFEALAECMSLILKKLKSMNVSYNFYLNYSPDKTCMRFHITFGPRIATWAGFELSESAIINSISPETAAAFYRSKK